MNQHRGPRTVAQGAATPVRLALLRIMAPRQGSSATRASTPGKMRQEVKSAAEGAAPDGDRFRKEPRTRENDATRINGPAGRSRRWDWAARRCPMSTALRTSRKASRRIFMPPSTPGINLLDTGDFYGMGHNEMLIRRALEGRRKDVLICVKFGALRGPDGALGGHRYAPGGDQEFSGLTVYAGWERIMSICISLALRGRISV